MTRIESGDLTDRRLGDFHLLRKLGSGGMADVFLAEQMSLQRHVAVKVMKPSLMAHSGQDMLLRFKREAMTAAGLNHPNIVQVYTIGQEGDLHYIAQEFVQGKDLGTILRERGNPDVASALHIMKQVAAALKAAGNSGIVHRDIKPENILITKKGEVKVADFGLAQLAESRTEERGVTMGTPHYMSPEQIRGQELDPRADIYSFGVTFYQLLCGETPFTGSTAVAIAMQHLRNSPPDLRKKNPAVPEVLCRLVNRMMAKSRTDRYQSAESVLEDIKKLLVAHKQRRSLDLVKLVHLETLERPKEKPPEKDDRSTVPGHEQPVEAATQDRPESVSLKACDDGAADTASPLVDEKSEKTGHEKSVGRPGLTRQSRVHAPPGTDENAPLSKSSFHIDHEELIDMTAMVDIVFFLLIFFLVTSMNGVRSSIPMPAPNPEVGNGSGASVVVPETVDELEADDGYISVSIDEEDRIRVEGSSVESVSELAERLKELRLAPSAPGRMLVNGHADATHGRMVEVLDAGQDAGIAVVKFAIDNEPSE